MKEVLGRLPVPADLAARVPGDDYARLLGYPDGRLPGGRVAERAAESRAWFARRGRPWALAASLGPIAVAGSGVAADRGVRFASAVLAERCREIRADRLVVALVSAGSEVDRETSARWDGDRPDEAYFLDRLGAAIAIHLGGWAAQHLRDVAGASGRALAPGYSPGYGDWDLAEQPTLAGCLSAAVPGVADLVRVHASGMIEPRNSLLAAFPLGVDRAAAEGLWTRHRCSWCSLTGCSLRGKLPLSPSTSGGP